MEKDSKGNYYVYVTEKEEQILETVKIARKLSVTVLQKNNYYAALESVGNVKVLTTLEKKITDGERTRIVP